MTDKEKQAIIETLKPRILGGLRYGWGTDWTLPDEHLEHITVADIEEEASRDREFGVPFEVLSARCNETRLSDETCEKVLELMRKGHLLTFAAHKLGITIGHVYREKRLNRDFESRLHDATMTCKRIRGRRRNGVNDFFDYLNESARLEKKS